MYWKFSQILRRISDSSRFNMSFVSRIWKCCSPQWCKVGFGSVRFKMSFVPKSGNAAVHDVAPLASKLNAIVIWLEECPTDICNEIPLFLFSFNKERIWC